ncbi:MAG: hypothetical protein A3E37_03710 [Candidatus Andersenbacteria bacterium RIFCSPHIGHO2_12_FULL_46_9]|nr:MAG: hypothetical protein A3I08_03065 [Candidatus Andersenbacteria bacterium RIFCSPLOWO2_02_FULL_46_11]OGY37730.1 MAG: hypothetical protein A3E37_03710 [Candidatus Andersenbacteria bacterium RIFCSPHIGHO2_12_FULL_46_9]OGY41624.1 MAG: hypothetical protein A3G57_01970 [Candidatus Andersenbacteria bacterium RIFCSPLOWO2_12_FULL_45_8]HBE90219.1 hypothetical protein [Candidatus Andersenbacteria bacterium]
MREQNNTKSIILYLDYLSTFKASLPDFMFQNPVCGHWLRIWQDNSVDCFDIIQSFFYIVLYLLKSGRELIRLNL